MYDDDDKTLPDSEPPVGSHDPDTLDPDRETAHLRGLARTIAKWGHATRRQAEEMVRSGRVQVDGRRVLDPGLGIDEDAEIRVDGRRLLEVIRSYLAFHKPLSVATGATVTHRTKLISEFLPRDVIGLAPAGRLDPTTSGLLLVSNDSNWNALAASGHGFDKEFHIHLGGDVTDVHLGLVRQGVQVPKSGLLKPRSIDVIQRDANGCHVRLVLKEGKVRQIRNLFQALRLTVESIHRHRIGPISLEGVPTGRWRTLSKQEVDAIWGGLQQKRNDP